MKVSTVYFVKNNGKLKDRTLDLNNDESLDSNILQSLLKQVGGELSITEENDVQTSKFTFAKKKYKGECQLYAATSISIFRSMEFILWNIALPYFLQCHE